MLGEMGDVVFGAKHSENFGFTFSSWYQDKEHQSVTLGNYSGDYESSKEAFAVRAGLVSRYKLFTEEESAELYRCMEHVRDSADLTFDQDQTLRELEEKICYAYPKFEDSPPSPYEDASMTMEM